MSSHRLAWILAILAALPMALQARSAYADPSKYPEFAQQTLPDNITPVFIHIEELVTELKSGAKPLIAPRMLSVPVTTTTPYGTSRRRSAAAASSRKGRAKKA